MFPALLFFLFVCSVLGFAAYGLFKFFFPDQGSRDEVAATHQTLDQLYVLDQITEEQFLALRQKLIINYPSGSVPDLSAGAKSKRQLAHREPENVQRPAVDPHTSEFVVPGESTAVPREEPTIFDAVAATPVPAQQPAVAALSSKTVKSFDDMPGAPSPPRRSWSDLLSGFMVENNIRWGELASGILIVGSAVGLVVSLREELRDTIPYFPALLFMLITAAINGAGVYTLKRWKLRNTSRGVLVIGLLLVPLNFLAACVLTDERRGVTDPIYWLAVTVGITGFSYMTWIASRCLLRWRNQPLTASVLGSSIGLLVTNRFQDATAIQWLPWALASMPLVSFVVGTGLFVPKLEQRKHWRSKTVNRLWLCLGIGAFAFLTSLSLIVIRSLTPIWSLILLTPILTAASVFTSWLGLTLVTSELRTPTSTPRIVATAICVLGLVLATACNFAALAMGATMVATPFVTGVAVLFVSWRKRIPQLLPIGWSFVSFALLAGLCIASDAVGWNEWTTPRQLYELVTSARSGLCLLALGVAILGMQRLFGGSTNSSSSGETAYWNNLSGVVLGALGCFVAVIASFAHPKNTFDNHAATALLGIASSALLVNVTRQKNRELFAYIAIGTTFVFLGHGLLWNQFLIQQIDQYLGMSCREELLFAIAALLFGLTAGGSHVAGHCSKEITGAGTASMAIALIGTALVIPNASGLASLLSLLATFSGLLLAWSYRSSNVARAFELASGAALAIIVAESCLRFELVTELLSVRHAAIQLAVLALWNAEWQAVGAYLTSDTWRSWLTIDRGRMSLGVCELLVIATVVFLVLGMAPQIGAELFSELSTEDLPPFRQNLTFVGTAMACVAISLLIGLTLRPRPTFVIGLFALWLLSWSLGGLPFEEARAVATANRWLLPIGGSIAALFVGSRSWWLPSYHHTRLRLGGAQAERWPNSQMQQVINLGLIAVVGVVLTITTLAICRFMVFGGDALGGPVWPSFFGKMRKDMSYGIPIGVIVSTFLFYAITERRSWLAVAGSLVYQYFVLVAVVLLFISPHPKLATEWFLHVLQAVSMGMSGYGLVWFYFCDRIRTQKVWSFSWTQLDIHTAINCLLVLSLTTLVTQRFFFRPEQAADWIAEAGGKFGIGALIALVALVFSVWRNRLTAYQYAVASGIGLTATAFVACHLDLNSPPSSWVPFRAMTVGATVTLAVLTGLLAKRRIQKHANQLRAKAVTILPCVITTVLAVAFSIRGSSQDPGFVLGYLLAFGTITTCILLYGVFVYSAWAPWFAAVTCCFALAQLREAIPGGLLASQEDAFFLQCVGVLALALSWTFFYLQKRVQETPTLRRSVLSFPNTTLLFATIVCWGMALGGEFPDSWLGRLAILLTVVLAVYGCWNDRGGWRVFSPYVLSLSLGLMALSYFNPGIREFKALALGILVASLVTSVWGYIFAKRARFAFWGREIGMLRLAALERNWQVRLPRLQLILAAVAVLGGIVVLANDGDRLARYATAVAPLLVGMSLIPFAAQPRKNRFHVARANIRAGRIRSGQEYVRQQPAIPPPTLLDLLPGLAITLLTIGGVYLSWADLPAFDRGPNFISETSRALLALAGIVFLYGWWLPARLDQQSPWISTIRNSTVVTCILAICVFAALLLQQGQVFQRGIGSGSGLPLPTSGAVTFVVLAMISGLLAIALLPQHDPLSLTEEQRQGYVYAAQFVTAMLGIHVYLSMPWLFEFGILKYWPYLAMFVSFGGVGIAQVLNKRQLKVLAEPIFNTGALIPVVTAIGFWAVDSVADASLVMLLAGLIYLIITVTNESLWSAVAAVIFGNLSLWLFYDKFPGLAFFSHPQIWLIPPAVSILVAAQVHRRRLSATQLAMARYVSLAVIYLSSTSEIFIRGLGKELLPPMILAVLAIGGIFAGMMFRVRAFLYLGSVFLLFAVVTMVAHAQQRLDHVWPWWAFGLTMGTAILVMFGLFEKRRSDMQAIVGQLKEWES